MRKSRFSDEKIVGILREHRAGASAADLCHKHGISDATFYKWRSRFGDLTVSEVKRSKASEQENARLKKLLAESMMNEFILKEMLERNF